jgi:hypothetical protein
MEEEFNLSNERHIVDGMLSVALHKIHFDKLEETKKFLNEGYYSEKNVRKCITHLIKTLKEESERPENEGLCFEYIEDTIKQNFGNALCTKDEVCETMNEQEAYELGKDCALNGANTTNCNFWIFTKPEFKDAWEKGQRDAKCVEDEA